MMVKKLMLTVIMLLISFASITYAAPVYMEGINDFETVDPGWSCSPMREVTFLYTPSFSYDLFEVDFFTNSGIGDFTVRLREDLGGAPGNILGEITFQLSGGSGFQGSEFISPIPLEGGSDYWVGYYSQYATGSHFASKGDVITEYTGGIDGNWDVGPIASLRPMIKFYGVPEPATILLLGLGGLIIRRLKFKN